MNFIKQSYLFHLGLSCLFIFCIIGFIDARLVPLEETVNEPLVIDNVAKDNILEIETTTSSYSISKRQASSPARANTTVCYDLVGCFDNNEPFNNAAFEVPQSPDFVNTAFLLFTQESPTNPEFISYTSDDETIKKSSVNPSRWLRIIIHGFQNNRDSVWIPKLQAELLKLKNVRKL